jgi:protein required for attachment to host cells
MARAKVVIGRTNAVRRIVLAKEVSRMVSQEIPKDLVNVPVHELPKRLQDVLKA